MIGEYKLIKIRIAKKIAESGFASRRDAERIITEGRVVLNGNVVTTPVCFVSDTDEIRIDGQQLNKKSDEILIWKFYKPKSVITSKKDGENRKTVFDCIKDQLSRDLCSSGRIIHIGRLDYNSEGLLLFTNNGDVSRKSELPSTGLERTYRARVFGVLTTEKLDILRKGVTISGMKYGKCKIEKENKFGISGGANTWLRITINEGKNREIRKMMEYIGCTVNRLIRISYGTMQIGSLKEGEIVPASKREVDELLKRMKFHNA